MPKAEIDDARRRDAEAGQARAVSPSASRTSFPAASASAWRSPARSPSGPKVLLLDEPLGALDKKLREETQFELMDLQQRARPDLRRRHPRPGRGDDHGRPHRRHGQGRDRAGGDAGRDLRGAGFALRRRLRRRRQHVRGQGRQPARPASPRIADRQRHHHPDSTTPATPAAGADVAFAIRPGEDRSIVQTRRPTPSTSSRARSATSPISAT